jgi:hypothetical protein
MSRDIQAELNRLANGGASYRTPINTVDTALAANQWAGTSNLDILAALNTKAGNARAAWRDLNGVCNQLAGTSSLEAPEALRRVVS